MTVRRFGCSESIFDEKLESIELSNASNFDESRESISFTDFNTSLIALDISSLSVEESRSFLGRLVSSLGIDEVRMSQCVSKQGVIKSDDDPDCIRI